ncbi:tripartite tricarboxylate transporter substrate binding protein [Oricola sp.]|uniref:tripartite tricarboxylate transporter substrate binding protein n=1 Tax=Oricola sp. TaxID=1979950 RepID=UPI0025E80DE2|nr:tripartite tricarboxylate transporter substrate binding protein [Oricola sp.]MCI5074091.1 tripartite tricarboxylate transporter substrate binding protein [Oricola sp.]
MLKKLFATALAAAALIATSASAQDYPSKPIKLIVPYGAGGGSDSLARAIQAAIEKYDLMPEPLVIVNVDAGGGVVGAREGKNAKPDGYTFLQAHNEIFPLALSGRLGFEVLDGLQPVAQTTTACNYLAVPASSQFQSFDEVTAFAKENPGDLKLADLIGGLSHYGLVAALKDQGVDIGIVQTGGTSARFASLKGGHTDLAVMSPGWIERGGDELRGLLWLGDDVPEYAGDMPTAKSAGLDIVGCLNRRYWAPKGTPQEAIDYFAGVLEKALDTPELKEFHAKSFANINFQTGDALMSGIQDEVEKFTAAAANVDLSGQ